MKKLGRELEVAYDIAYAARTRHYTLVECRKSRRGLDLRLSRVKRTKHYLNTRFNDRLDKIANTLFQS